MLRFFYKIYFRLKYSFSYKDSMLLDHVFINWANKVVKYFLTRKIKLEEVDEKVLKDYQKMLDLIDDLYENYISTDEKMVKKYQRFCLLFKKHSAGLWTNL